MTEDRLKDWESELEAFQLEISSVMRRVVMNMALGGSAAIILELDEDKKPTIRIVEHS